MTSGRISSAEMQEVRRCANKLLGREHRNKANEAQRERYRNNKDAALKYFKRRHQEVRARVLMAYGGKCACCDEKEIDFLCVDHVNGGGIKHRKTIGKSCSSGHLFRWLIKNNFPSGFQVLCYNCNAGKERPGGCTHKRNRVEENYLEES